MSWKIGKRYWSLKLQFWEVINHRFSDILKLSLYTLDISLLSARRALLYLVFFLLFVESFVSLCWVFCVSLLSLLCSLLSHLSLCWVFCAICWVFCETFLKISSFSSISNGELCHLLSLLCLFVESFVSFCWVFCGHLLSLLLLFVKSFVSAP